MSETKYTVYGEERDYMDDLAQLGSDDRKIPHAVLIDHWVFPDEMEDIDVIGSGFIFGRSLNDTKRALIEYAKDNRTDQFHFRIFRRGELVARGLQDAENPPDGWGKDLETSIAITHVYSQPKQTRKGSLSLTKILKD